MSEFFLTYQTSQWVLLALTALLVGMSKSGIQGVTLLVIPLMALSFGAKPSTGLILPLLCMADIFAVMHYRRVANWTYIGFAELLCCQSQGAVDNPHRSDTPIQQKAYFG